MVCLLVGAQDDLENVTEMAYKQVHLLLVPLHKHTFILIPRWLNLE